MKFEHSDFKRIWDSISEEQREALKAKAQWEHMSLSAVMIEWPQLIAPHTLPYKLTLADQE